MTLDGNRFSVEGNTIRPDSIALSQGIVALRAGARIFRDIWFVTSFGSTVFRRLQIFAEDHTDFRLSSSLVLALSLELRLSPRRGGKER